jgi:hypothetical protein
MRAAATANPSHAAWYSPVQCLRSAQRRPPWRSRKRRRSRRSVRKTPNIRVRRRANSSAMAASTSNRRMRVNSSKARSIRAAGASSFTRRPKRRPENATEVVPKIGFFPLFGPIGAAIKVGNKPAIVLIVAMWRQSYHRSRVCGSSQPSLAAAVLNSPRRN